MAQCRNELIDFYKGFLMFGVIWGHTITALKGGQDVGPIFIHTFLRIYDMPFFMILSGFFLGKSMLKNNSKNVFLNRVSMILFPVVLWNLAVRNLNFSSFYFLWAVFLSSVISIIGFRLGRYFKKKGIYIELSLECLVIIGLYVVNIPWNMFYLYPFFVVGRHLPNIDFHINHVFYVLSLFVFGMCYWQGQFTLWALGYDAWQTDSWSIFIYIYRFLLGILGTYIVANVLRIFYSLNWKGKSFLIKSGKQTLAIYILQTFLVEKTLNHLVRQFVQKYDILYNSFEINILGYVIAPFVAYLVLCICSNITDIIKHHKYIKYVFGFKIVK